MENRIWKLLTPLVLLALFMAVLPTAAGPAAAPIAPQNLDLTPIWSSIEEDATFSVAWGDWDGDGDLDLAVGNYIEPNRVYENIGGSMVLAWTSPESDSTHSVAWGDWDGDGDLDLAVGNYWGPNRVYENTGGSLALAWSSTEEDRTTSLAWGDWDNDGDLDLAVGNYLGPIRVYENTGGDLTLAWSTAENSCANSIAWGDWDGDGDLDLAVGKEGYDSVYENSGGALTLAWSSTENETTHTIAWGDWDNDGDLDLATSCYWSPIRVYENTGGDLTLAWSTAENSRAYSIAWGDWDGDGDLDLAVGCDGHPNRVYENTGGDLVLAWSSPESEWTVSVAWGDWDGDGDLDLAVGNEYEANRVYENLAGPLATTAAWSSAETDNTRSVAWGDIDGDGDLDLAVGNTGFPGTANRVYWNQNGVLEVLWTSPEIDDTRALAWGDIDGDGDLDLAVGNYRQANLVYEYAGGAFSLLWASPELNDTTTLAWGDWDGDGDLDLAVGNQNQPNLVYQNTGGVLSLAWTSPESDATYSVAWGDWDGDGDLDLAVGNYLDPNRVYANTGGDLALAWSSAEGDATLSVAWGDFDRDGDLDLAVGNAGQPNRVYENTGGALTLLWSSVEIAETRGVAWGDWDGDGDLDLATGNIGQPVRVYDNLGGTLEAVAAWSSVEADNTYAIAWGDYDADGDLDLLAGNGQVERLYLNNRIARPNLPNQAPHPVVYRPGQSADAYFYSSAEILTGAKVPIFFRLYDAESDPVARIAARYSTDGGGQWHVATITGTVTHLSASPTGQLHAITWDALADGARGDNVVFRLISVLDNPTAAGFPIQRPYVSADTTPFRLRPLAVALLPFRQLGIGPAGTTITHTLTLVNRTGRAGIFAVGYDSFRGWPVAGPALVGPVADLGMASFTVTTTVPAGPAGVLDVITATTAALFNPAAFNTKAYIFTYRGTPDVALSVTKEAPATVEAAGVLTYTLVAHNAGTSPAGGVVITDTLPAEVAFAWASDDGVYSPTLGAVLWPDNLLFAGRSLTVTVAVTVGCVPAGTPIVNDDYAAAGAQAPTPVSGPPVTTTVLYDAPIAAFTLGTTEVNLGEPLTVTNDSQNATAYLWEFGDGTSSTLAEPQHSYLYEGVYTVTLTAANACGSEQAAAQITATLFLQAGFESNAPVCLGEIVVFTNTTAGMPPFTYTWEFDDGITSTLEHPTHTYAAAGPYLVSLRVLNAYGEGLAADMVEVLPPPTADFTYTVNELTASFVNTSSAADSYLWNFGDGNTSSEADPVHAYAAGGTYTVTLAAAGVCGTDEAAMVVTVAAGSPYRVFLPLVARH